MIRDLLANIYLDWKNNYLTISTFAEHMGLTEFEAENLIRVAKSCFYNPHPER